MSVLIPPAVNYPSPLTAVPGLSQDQPKEGRKQIPVQIDWGSMGGVNKTVGINIQNNATLNITQIATLKVDNSQCGADVVFIFPDTSDTITVPAGSPLAVVPVFSNALQMYVSAPNALSTDVTRFQILNYFTMPTDIPEVATRNASSSGANVITQATNTTFQLIPAGINGTLQLLQAWLSVSTNPASPVQFVFSVKDGAGTPKVLINQFNFVIPAANPKIDLVNMNDVNWRFQNGLVMPVQGASGTGSAILNILSLYNLP